MRKLYMHSNKDNMKISSKYEQHATDLCYSSSLPPSAPPPLTAVRQLLVLLLEMA